MIRKRTMRVLCVLALLLGATLPASAQITTGTVSGTVKDAQGGVVPGATIVLISETQGTKSLPTVTNATGDYVFPNVAADTYTVEASMEGFKTLQRKNVKVSGGDRVVVPNVTLEVGGAAETVNVQAESPMIQAQSGERSYAITTDQIEKLPINHTNFTNVVTLTPGVVLNVGGSGSGGSAGATRLGGAGQNNIMMDGISAMDTGNNGQMLNMNVESIAEVKVLTQSYQAEFGRSSGLQITAVTKSGTNRFHGSAFDILGNSDWNTNSWVNDKNGDKKIEAKAKTLGYSIGGPVGKQGGNNKLFFFYSHQFVPATTYSNGGNVIRLRVPTLEERNGIFTNSKDNNGNPIPQLLNPTTRAPYANNVIPAGDFYSLGQTILRRYPEPNVQQAPGTNYNYQIDAPSTNQLTQQPALKIDYQVSPKLRFSGKYSGQIQRPLVQPGGTGAGIPGFSDSYVPYPIITNWGITANWVVNSTTFVEGNYGLIKNELAGGNEGGILVNDAANRLTALPGFPLIYNDAGKIPTNSYAYGVMQVEKPPFFDGTSVNLPPIFGWGSLIGAAPPNQRYPGWLNINRTQDYSVSVTKISGHHTFKGGFYNNHSFKAQNVGAGGIANLSFQGFVNFGNGGSNPLDTGFGFANALTGVYQQYLQASNFTEGSMLYNNTEGYIQDNWKVNSRFTLDYGMRITHQQPQYDQFQQMSNFFTDKYNPAAAPTLYVPGCSGGAATCGTQQAMDPRNGQIVVVPGATSSAALIGTPIVGSGNAATNGILRAGDGISKYSYNWPNLVYGPRFGYAYDLTGSQKYVLRGGGGWFFDRPDGNTVFSIPGNPPISTSSNLLNGTLQNVGSGSGLSPQPVPALVVFQYNAKVPASIQWNTEIQMTLPWSSAFTVAYVGNHGYDRLGSFQGGTTVNVNAVDFGTAYLPQYQNTTLTAPSTVPGANAVTANLLRPYKGLSTIQQQTTEFHDTYHSVQFQLQRRYRDGFAFGVNYTRGLSFTGNTGLQKRLQHNPDGSFSIRSDQADYEKLNETLDLRPNIIKANALYDIPKLKGSDAGAMKALGYVLNDWQISGLLTMGSGIAYDLNYNYQSLGGTPGQGTVNQVITGSPDYQGRIVYTGDPGSGCSSDQYKQFNTASVTGPQPGSLGLESGRNLLRGCMDKTVDMALAKSIRLGGQRNLQFRMDVFNLFNTYVINGRNNTIQYTSPSNLTILNSQTRADGSLDPARLTPRTAGFGAANGAQNRGGEAGLGNNYNRVAMFQVRFQF